MAALTASSAGEVDVTTSPTVTVAADAEWSFGAAVATSEAPPPPPPPPAPVVERPTDRPASRTTERTATEDAPEQEVAAAPVAAPSASGNAIVDIAFRYVGTPYVYGGTTPAGFDCSGFTQYVYAQVGITLPRTSSAQSGAGTRVSAAEARPGDLVWWPGHIGIYLGGNQHIAARSPGTPLHASQIWNSNPIFIRVS
ncbi:C40 family peptidase [Occultella aeris]|uniref:Putative endopeptidase p60 n=1 Tax=Occultella aeris TaxID=2761496 RepID=A0A7M4DKR6_9MICO|nr:C40 family peptidase [Occultella aeris]VZO37757.1 putative endopeptidase p60 precursor [Occultella aeris]